MGVHSTGYTNPKTHECLLGTDSVDVSVQYYRVWIGLDYKKYIIAACNFLKVSHQWTRQTATIEDYYQFLLYF